MAKRREGEGGMEVDESQLLFFGPTHPQHRLPHIYTTEASIYRTVMDSTDQSARTGIPATPSESPYRTICVWSD